MLKYHILTSMHSFSLKISNSLTCQWSFRVSFICSNTFSDCWYKKGIYNKVADILSRPIISASFILKNSPIMHESYVEQYALDTDFKEVYETLCHSNHVEELDYHVHDNLLYHLGKICIPQGERINIIRESHSSLIAGHFGVGKTVANF
jgi:hypothetical protein